MKKTKQPGDNFSLKTKKTEDPLVMQWINSQSNLMDSLRYLIEREIQANGVRNLQAHIPMERNVLKAGSYVSTETANETASTAHFDHVSAREPELPAEEEFDEEDIESWI